LLNDQELSCRLFSRAQIWYRVGTCDNQCTANVQGQRYKGQGHSVKTSPDRQIITHFLKIGVAKSNDDVRILIGNSQLAVWASG